MRPAPTTPPDVINLRRIELGISFSQLQRDTGINRSTLSQHVKFYKEFKLSHLEKIGQALDLPSSTWFDAA
jgi:transcriptional regulator with XRE-family HTH domain